MWYWRWSMVTCSRCLILAYAFRLVTWSSCARILANIFWHMELNISMVICDKMKLVLSVTSDLLFKNLLRQNIVQSLVSLFLLMHVWYCSQYFLLKRYLMSNHHFDFFYIYKKIICKEAILCVVYYVCDVHFVKDAHQFILLVSKNAVFVGKM